MKSNLHFTHELPINSSKAKKAFFGMLILIILCIGAYILSQIFWDQFTEMRYSIRSRRNVMVGWPVTVQNWSIYIAIGTLVTLPFLYFMQDWKNPSLAMTNSELFINQQMMRNKLIPFSNIEKAEKTSNGYKLHFKDVKAVIAMQKGISKPFVKYNLENDNFYISDTHTAGDVDAFFEELSKRINYPS